MGRRPTGSRSRSALHRDRPDRVVHLPLPGTAGRGTDTRPDPVPHPLERSYTIIPLVIVAILFVFIVQSRGQRGQRCPRTRPSWSGSTPSSGAGASLPQRLPGGRQRRRRARHQRHRPARPTLPTGETVQINLFSDDVNHSFYVPAFLFKRDTIQGINNSSTSTSTSVRARSIGPVQQICGTYHPYMRFLVDVMAKPSEFNTWYPRSRPELDHDFRKNSRDMTLLEERPPEQAGTPEPRLMEIIPGPGPRDWSVH